MLRLGLVVALTIGTARAGEPARPLVLLAPGLGGETAQALEAEATRRGLALAAPAPRPEPAAEALLSDVRPLYQEMAFGPAVKRLEAAEAALLDGRVPTPATARALAEVELWLGACLFLAHERAPAEERWALALRLDPAARPDGLFPPEVHKAFAQRRAAARPVAVQVKLAPLDARLWIDGRLQPLVEGEPLQLAPGLHWVVAERADLEPAAQIARVIHAAPQLALALTRPAEPQAALRQAQARLAAGALGRDEALGISARLGRPLAVIEPRAPSLATRTDAPSPAPGGHGVAGTRYAAADPTRAVLPLAGSEPAALVAAVCAVDPCAPAPAPLPEAALAARAAPVEKPAWKRGWFWGALGAGFAVAAGVAIGVGVGLTAPRHYDLHVR